MTTCRSCGAPVLWAVTAAGKRIPLDPEPQPDGNVVIASEVHPRTSVECVHAEVVPARSAIHPDRLRYQAHFASCPNAAQHRRRVPGGTR